MTEFRLPLENTTVRSHVLKIATTFMVAVGLLAITAPVRAQHPNVDRGFTPSGMFDVGGIDAVNGFNGNLTIHLPIGGSYPVGGPMGSYAFSLNYNSNVWEHVTRPGSCVSGVGEGHPVMDVLAVPDPYANAGLGWTFSLGNIGTLTSIGGHDAAPRPGLTTYRSMDGSEHALYATYPAPGGGYATDPGYWFSNDGSYLRFQAASQTLEMPDGMRETFANGLPASLFDRFGNGLTITYPSYFPAPNAGIPSVWRIEDGYRTHFVYFRLTGYAAPEQTVVVDRIVLAAFNGQTATYRFLYNDEVPGASALPEVHMRGFGTQLRTCNPFVDWFPRVVLLTKILLPDGTEYAMPVSNYFAPNGAYPGPLRLLKLPATGAIGWDYTLNALPAPRVDDDHLWTVPTWSSVVGVSHRTLFNEAGSSVGVWSYTSAYDVASRPNEIVREVRFPPAESGASQGHVVRTYYSACVYASCLNEPGALDGPSDTYAEDFGLPFSRRAPGDGQGRYLSQEIFAAGAVTPLRRIYVAYENDGDPTHPNLPFDSTNHLNQRPRSEHVVYLDDPKPASLQGGYFSSTTESDDFDGLGHYRRVTRADDFGFGTSRVETTQWNPSGRPRGAAAWILNTFDSQEQQEGRAIQHQEFVFEPDTGFLKCQRLRKNGRRRHGFDLVTQFEHTDPTKPGQITVEKWFGGDKQDIGTTTNCDSLGKVPTYTYNHGYSFGQRTRTSIDVGGAAGGALVLLDLESDASTGLPSTARDSAGRPTVFTYDLMGRLLTTTPQGDAPTTIEYHVGPSMPPAIQMSVGSGTTLELKHWFLDGLGRVVQDDFGLPASQIATRLTEYDALGWTTRLSERGSAPNLSVGTKMSGFDPFGRPKMITAADGKVTKLEYAGIRVVKRMPKIWNGTKEVPVTEREDYDSLGRLHQVKEGNDTWTRYEYDVGGRLTTVVNNSGTGTASNGQTRTFTYDGRGFLTTEVQPESGTNTYQYDARGNVTRRTTPTGTTLSEYDAAGRLVVVRSSSQAELSRLVYRADSKVGSAIAYNDRKVGSACTRFEVRQDFAYDPQHGRRSSEDTTLKQSGIAQPLQKWTQSYLYDGAGRMTQVTYPTCLLSCTATPRTVSTSYEMGLPVAVPGFASSITYNANGTLGTILHANGAFFVSETDATGMPRVAALQALWGGNAVWPKEAYDYDSAGNIKSIGQKGFGYDQSARLISAKVPSAGPLSYQSYTYDVFNNLTKVARGSNPNASDTTYVPYDVAPGSNRLLGADYDASGNMKSYQGSTYSWDQLQHMATVSTGGEAWTHTYNASGERVWSWRTAPSRVDTYALRGPDGKVLTDFTQTGVAYTWEDYAYRDGQLLGAKLSDGSVRHFDVDHLGSVRLETGAPGTVPVYRDFWPYGEEATAPTGTEQMKFTGHERDLGDPSSTADDLDYMHARYYRPGLGRFLTPDPEPGAQIRSRPAVWNRFTYASCNPIGRFDPSGRKDRRSDEDKAILEDPDVLAAAGTIIDMTNMEKPLQDRQEAGAVVSDLGNGDYGISGGVKSDGKLNSVDFTFGRTHAGGIVTAAGEDLAATLHSHPGSGDVRIDDKTVTLVGAGASTKDQAQARLTGKPLYIFNGNSNLLRVTVTSSGRVKVTSILTRSDYKMYIDRAQKAAVGN